MQIHMQVQDCEDNDILVYNSDFYTTPSVNTVIKISKFLLSKVEPKFREIYMV